VVFDCRWTVLFHDALRLRGAHGEASVTGGGEEYAGYDKLEQIVLPLYYENRSGWIAVMKGAIAKNALYFNSHRMLRRYTSNAYVR